MFNINIKGIVIQGDKLTLKTDNRNVARNAEILCRENGLDVETVVEVAPRVVKFKDVKPSAAADAKADAKADTKPIAQKT